MITNKKFLENLSKTLIHIGFSNKDFNPKMAPYIKYKQEDKYIFDLNKISKLLEISGNILQKISKNNKIILFVGTDKLSSPLISFYAKKCNSFYINYRWLGGLLTNWITIKEQINRLNFLEYSEKSGDFDNLDKKKFIKIQKEIINLRRIFNGIKNMEKLPDIVIFANQLENKLAIKECIKLGIPVISLVNTNSDPDLIPFPIPANTESLAALNFIFEFLTKKINYKL